MEQKKRTRTPKEVIKSVHIAIRLTKQEKANLDKIAKAKNTTISKMFVENVITKNIDSI
jgi:uncharacterized protein (DUF1778 family)